MQGTAADIIKRAMIEVDNWLGGEDFDAVMVMQVHDELVFEVREAWVDSFIEEVKRRMQAAAELSVTLIVEAESGANWDEAH
jgi:DNA polymerase-1